MHAARTYGISDLEQEPDIIGLLRAMEVLRWMSWCWTMTGRGGQEKLCGGTSEYGFPDDPRSVEKAKNGRLARLAYVLRGGRTFRGPCDHAQEQFSEYHSHHARICSACCVESQPPAVATSRYGAVNTSTSCSSTPYPRHHSPCSFSAFGG